MKKYLTSRAVLVELASRIKTYRIEASITQEELADLSGVTRRSISALENGEDVKLSTFFKVLIALDLDSNFEMLIPDVTTSINHFI